jgi:hypothetical protein
MTLRQTTGGMAEEIADVATEVLMRFYYRGRCFPEQLQWVSKSCLGL